MSKSTMSFALPEAMRSYMAGCSNGDHLQRSNLGHHHPNAAFFGNSWSNTLLLGRMMVTNTAHLLYDHRYTRFSST